MPGHVMSAVSPQTTAVSSAQLVEAIRAVDFSGGAATVIGYGNMGKHYVRALRSLGIQNIRVHSRSEEPLAELRGIEGVTTADGGYINFKGDALSGELGIVATPTGDLIGAAEHLADRGFRNILIEKPVSLLPSEIQRLAQALEDAGIDAVCAYNRVAYPSFIEARCRSEHDGGITSCTYAFTEFVDRIGPGIFSDDELARWGIANSLHVMSMAHGLIGLPESWNGHQSGSISWHPSGAVFVGSGVSERRIPFGYHADWGSTGRWSVEVHTSGSSYRLCPLEKVYARESALADWVELPVAAFDPSLKSGIAEQIAAMLSPKVRESVPLISLGQAARLAKFGEQIFGYPAL